MQVGVLGASEVDFVCTKPDKTAYVQVTYLMGDQSTRNREFGPLEKIRDNHPKYVISATPLLSSRDLLTPMAMSGDCSSMEVMTPQVSQSKPYFARS